jgi:ribosome biogenesis GTPase
VGDRVTFQPLDGEAGEISAIHPRSSELSRSVAHRGRGGQHSRVQVLAANVAQVVIVAALHDPPFRTGLVYRLLVTTRLADLAPLLCITKCDLDTGGEYARLADQFGDLGIPVLGTRQDRAASLEPLLAALAGRISILVGHSGVGKTSLLNALTDQRMRVAEVGFFKDRGRHTTSTARMIPLQGGGMAIDAPGIREFGLQHIDPQTLAGHFPGFGPYQGRCRFRDCRHLSENGCAVREALAAGQLREAHYSAYQRLLADEDV